MTSEQYFELLSEITKHFLSRNSDSPLDELIFTLMDKSASGDSIQTKIFIPKSTTVRHLKYIGRVFHAGVKSDL